MGKQDVAIRIPESSDLACHGSILDCLYGWGRSAVIQGDTGWFQLMVHSHERCNSRIPASLASPRASLPVVLDCCADPTSTGCSNGAAAPRKSRRGTCSILSI